MNTMLTYLCGYGLDHHSRAIVDLMPFMIQKELPAILPYVNSRLQQTEQVKNITKGCLNPNSKGITESQLWFNFHEWEKKMMNQVNKDNETEVERPIKVEFVDIPRVYNYQDELTDSFFFALAHTNQYQIFESKIIQRIIEFNYPLVREWTIKRLTIPFNLF